MHPALVDYWTGQSRTFGDDRVWVCRARDLPQVMRNSTSVLVVAGIVAAFAIIALGSARHSAVLAGLGGFFLVVVLLGSLVRLIVAQRAAAYTGLDNWRDSSLVIGPAGLGLAQGDLVGELRWVEVQGVRLRNSKAARDCVVELAVDGAQIRIADIYQSSLEEIYQRIVEYWGQG
jgi:hypothetical protein